jgi:hypothetical protein
MRVSELVALLGRMDQSLEVLAHAQHGDCKYQYFDIGEIELRTAYRSRDEIGLPQVEIGHEKGRPLAVLTLTADF